ncbi:hypothetical protein FRUB_05169 [Fimbriiglobus ruber]|uniref:Uncharacterized protein n=1 Tax=Fimbriiglobus ruber TaxID=1908690 RepID=A0A225DFC7_9BACT|nr:hypothetical protein FRUB_05169 [Fimbriiglobus ruber]
MKNNDLRKHGMAAATHPRMGLSVVDFPVRLAISLSITPSEYL